MEFDAEIKDALPYIDYLMNEHSWSLRSVGLEMGYSKKNAGGNIRNIKAGKTKNVEGWRILKLKAVCAEMKAYK